MGANINIPVLESVYNADGTLTINASTAGQYPLTGIGSVGLNLNPSILGILSMDIVRRECACIDDSKGNLNDLVNSGNNDDFNLAINMMEAQELKYAPSLLRAIRMNNSRDVMNTLERYYQRNRLNITNRIL